MSNFQRQMAQARCRDLQSMDSEIWLKYCIFIGCCEVLSRPRSRDAETRNERNSPRVRLAWRPNVDATLHNCSSSLNLPKFHTKLEMLKLFH